MEYNYGLMYCSECEQHMKFPKNYFVIDGNKYVCDNCFKKHAVDKWIKRR